MMWINLKKFTYHFAFFSDILIINNFCHILQNLVYYNAFLIGLKLLKKVSAVEMRMMHTEIKLILYIIYI